MARARGQSRAAADRPECGSRDVAEQAAIAGAFAPGLLADRKAAEAAASEVARRLDALAPAAERGWQGEVDRDRRAGLQPEPPASPSAACSTPR